MATQDPELRKKFQGQPEHVINFCFFVAEDLRRVMADLGFRKLDDMVGRVDCLVQRRDVAHWKATSIDLSPILYNPPVPHHVGRRCLIRQDHGIENALDNSLLEYAHAALENRTPVSLSLPIRNVHRSVGAMVSGEIARRYGSEGLPDDTIQIHFQGSAGQSFAAFLAKGVTLTLEGEANDYVGKGLSGGRLIVYPPRPSEFVAEENILIGNVCLYGATSGEAFFNGMAGERFAVRNSGMTGGIAFVLDRTGGEFANILCNRRDVDLGPVVDPKDIEMLLSLLTRHGEYTGSPQTKWILDNWEAALPQFVKVFPQEYKRVLGIPKASAGVLASRAAATPRWGRAGD